MDLTTADSGNKASSALDSQQHIRLACQACQRKKIKCDRTFPCGQCTKSTLTCIPSSRKQRTRAAHGRRIVDGELHKRIQKLESLVESLSGEAGVPTERQANGDGHAGLNRVGSIDHDASSSSAAVESYVASPFWSSLTNEVAALRDVLQEEDDEDDDAPDSQGLSDPIAENVSTVEYDLMLTPPGRVFVMPGVIVEPTEDAKRRLSTAFFENVEPMIKLFHRPTIQNFIENDAPYLGHPPDAPASVAVRRVVWFSAINTLSDAEARSLTGQSKQDALMQYRRMVGVALTHADLINTSDLATLQCFIMFIMACRGSDTSRRTWTILALVVRIAYAMNLHQDDPRATPFMSELRRRTWGTIRFLDKFYAVDRGSPPLIGPTGYSIPVPIDTNDDLFSPSSTSIPTLDNQLTDMSFALMCFDACETVEQLNMPEVQPSGATWEMRHKLALDFCCRIEQKYLRFCDLGDSYQRFRHAVGRSMASSMILRAVRPMQRHVSSIPPRVDSPYILQMAVDNLSASEGVFEDPEAERWRWLTWVQWHALAVALAGLCNIRGTELAHTAWHFVERQYVRSEQIVADGRDGMLWRPIQKLYKRATAFRDSDPALRSTSRAVDNTSKPQVPSQNPPALANNAVSPWEWPQAVSTTPLSHSLTDPVVSNLDSLSTNFSTLDPFAFPATSTTTAFSNLSLDPMAMPDSDFNVPMIDPSWDDWLKFMGDSGADMEMDLGVDGWS